MTLLKSSLEKSVVNVPTAPQCRNNGPQEGVAACLHVRIELLRVPSVTSLPLSHLPLCFSSHAHTLTHTFGMQYKTIGSDFYELRYESETV